MPEKHPQRSHLLAQARSKASEVPLETAEVAADVAALAVETARVGNAHLTGDSITGALIAEAACRASARLVEINLVGEVDPRLARASDAVKRAAAAREEALRIGEEVMR
jgi:formiminotetrahydrofolate cyclodeaminase